MKKYGENLILNEKSEGGIGKKLVGIEEAGLGYGESFRLPCQLSASRGAGSGSRLAKNSLGAT